LAPDEFAIKRNLLARILSASVVRVQAKLSSKILFTLVSTRAISKKKILSLAKTENTVFHIHNWYNLIPESQIYELSKTGFPVVVTLHDQRLLTGGCHYTFDCTEFINGCANCPTIINALNQIPEKVVSKREKYLAKGSMQPWLTYVAPSRWMESEAKKSKQSSKISNIFIPNVLGPSFKTEGRVRARKPGEKLRVGIASMDPNSYVKGGDVIQELISMAEEGKSHFELLFLKDFASTTERIREFWQQLDFLLVSSRADNSPNVIHEAHQYGVPVIASQVGGISELLIANFDYGFPLEKMSATYLAGHFEMIISSGFLLGKAHRVATNTSYYSSEAVKDHIKLYASFFVKPL
jgi:glycosyltransferase involved in cell wall biosynthesis